MAGRTPVSAPVSDDRGDDYVGAAVIFKEFGSDNYLNADPFQRVALRKDYLLGELPGFERAPAGAVPTAAPGQSAVPLEGATVSSSVLLPVLLLAGVAGIGWWWNNKRKRR